MQFDSKIFNFRDRIILSMIEHSIIATIINQVKYKEKHT